jgi:GAF domain-containing protein
MADIHVLLIDDNDRARRSLARYLSKTENIIVDDYGYSSEGLKALRKRKGKYTAVLLDFVLRPEDAYSGEEVLHHIRQVYPQLPVIVLTGVDPSGGVQTIEQGAYRYIRRPVDVTELVNILRNLDEQAMIFSVMVRDVRRMLQADLCIAWRFDRKANVFQIVDWDGQVDSDYLETKLERGFAIPGTLFEKDQPLYFYDVRDEQSAPDYEYRDKAIEYGWHSMFSIPLMHRDRILGLLDAYTIDRPCPFDAAEREVFLKNILPAYTRQATEAIRNAEYHQRLQALQGINQLLVGSVDEDTIIRQILAKALDLVGTNMGWIFLKDYATGKLVLQEGIGIPEDVIGEERDSGEGISGWVIEEGQALNIADVSKDERHWSLSNIEVRSEISVPLRRGEETIGALTAKSPYVDTFTDDDLDLLLSLASQAAIAIERAKLDKHLQEISNLTLSEHYEKLADYVVKAARDLTGADVVLWGWKDSVDGDSLDIKASCGNFSEEYQRTATIPLDPEVSITAHALQEKRLINIDNVWQSEKYPKFHNSEEAKKQDWHSLMIVPIVGEKHRILGSLSLYSSAVAKFGESHINLMKIFANQVTVALEYVRALKNERAMRKQAEILRDVSVAVNTALDIQEIGKKILDELEKIIDYRQASIQIIKSIDLPRKRIASHGIEPDPTDDEAWALQPVSADKLIQRVVNQRRPLILSDVRDDPNWEEREEVKGVKSWVGIPLVDRDEIVGLMTLDHSDVGAYTQKDENILELFGNQVAVAVRNALLLERQTKRIEEMDLLQRTAAMVNAEKDKRKTLELIVKSSLDLTDMDSGVIYIVDEAREEVTDQYEYPSDFGHPTPRFSQHEGLTWTIVRSGNLVSIPDAINDSRVKPEMIEKGAKSIIGVPLKTKDTVIGVMYLNDSSPHPFTDEEKALLSALAEHAAIAITNARFHQAQITSFREISASIAASLDIEEMLQGILESLLQLLGEANLGEIRLIDEDTKELVAIAQHGSDVDERHRSIPMGEGITGYVASTEESLLVPDVDENLPDGVSYIPFLEGTRSELAVPMIKDEQVIGVLNIEHPDPNAFTEEDLHLTKTIAGLAVVALENARLLKDAKAKAKAEEARARIEEKRIGEMKALNALEEQLSELEKDL